MVAKVLRTCLTLSAIPTGDEIRRFVLRQHAGLLGSCRLATTGLASVDRSHLCRTRQPY